MSTKGRFRLAPKYKLLLWLVGLFVLWQFLMNDHVSNALLDLLLGGQVPGTKTVLAPNTVITIVVVLFGLGVAALIIKAWLNYRRRKRLTAADLTHGHSVTAPGKLAVAVLVVLDQAEAQPEPAVQRRHSARSRTRRRRLPVSSSPDWLARHFLSLQPKFKHARRTATHARGLVSIYVLAGYELARLGSLQAWKQTKRASAVLWRWLKPHLLHFDTWLELRIAEFEIWLSMRLKRSEALKFGGRVVYDAKQVVRELFTSRAEPTTKKPGRKANKL